MAKNDTDTYFEEYAEAAGLRPADMPARHHPLLENDDDVNTLADLIDVRNTRIDSASAVSAYPFAGHAGQSLDDIAIDVDRELTFPHSPHHATYDDLPDATGFDADARTQSLADDPDDESYLTLEDFTSSMNESDPDENASAPDENAG